MATYSLACGELLAAVTCSLALLDQDDRSKDGSRSTCGVLISGKERKRHKLFDPDKSLRRQVQIVSSAWAVIFSFVKPHDLSSKNKHTEVVSAKVQIFMPERFII